MTGKSCAFSNLSFLLSIFTSYFLNLKSHCLSVSVCLRTPLSVLINKKNIFLKRFLEVLIHHWIIRVIGPHWIEALFPPSSINMSPLTILFYTLHQEASNSWIQSHDVDQLITFHVRFSLTLIYFASPCMNFYRLDFKKKLSWEEKTWVVPAVHR